MQRVHRVNKGGSGRGAHQTDLLAPGHIRRSRHDWLGAALPGSNISRQILARTPPPTSISLHFYLLVSFCTCLVALKLRSLRFHSPRLCRAAVFLIQTNVSLLLIQTNVSRPQGQSCYKSQEGLELMGEWLRTSGSGSPHLSLPRATLSPRLKKTLTTREAARTRSDSTSERGARAATCHCSILDSGRLMGAGPDAHHPQITAF